MTRNIAARLATMLIGHVARERYPTRSVEYMLAWMLVAWSFMVALPGAMLQGSQYQYMTLFMPEAAWAAIGITVGALRLFALIRNGSWSRSPYLRLAGASVGFIFWQFLALLYGIAFMHGAPLFPMYGCLPVFMFFEAYSSFRCGQDARDNAAKAAAGK